MKIFGKSVYMISKKEDGMTFFLCTNESSERAKRELIKQGELAPEDDSLMWKVNQISEDVFKAENIEEVKIQLRKLEKSSEYKQLIKKGGTICIFKMKPSYKKIKKLSIGNVLGENIVVLGSPGRGKHVEPWKWLKPCTDDKQSAVLINKQGKCYFGGPVDSVMAVCIECGRHTAFKSPTEAVTDWNKGIVYEISDESSEEHLIAKTVKDNMRLFAMDELHNIGS